MFHHEKDEYTRLQIADRMSEINEKEGHLLLIDILQNGELPFVKEEIYQKIKKRSKIDFEYDTTKKEEDNKRAIKEMIEWIETL